MQVDLRVTRLLCSTICHDVMNKLANLSLGLETLKDEEPTTESLNLVVQEGEMATKQLAFFRIAFGNGTGESGLTGKDGIKEARKIATQLLEINNINLAWDDSRDDLLVPVANRLALKLILNVIHCVGACVFRNGQITTRIENIDGDIGVLFTGTGPVARLRPDFLRALYRESNIEDLTAQTAPAWYTSCLAEEIKSEVDAHDTGGAVQFAVVLPVKKD
ncbi:MAG: histidine phosphotransferase family protein [Alphaproteobacteria bacterium]